MADSSFDVVSKVDRQELMNAVNQAAKEIGQRYDFRGVGAEVELAGETIHMKASTGERCLAVLDVLQTKMVKRGVSLKALELSDDGEPRVSGKEYRLDAGLKDGITSEQAKKVTKMLRDDGPKSVKTQIQGDEVRVTSKSRDDLQAVQQMLREADLDFAVQFTNRR